jgi:hypothetical protein
MYRRILSAFVLLALVLGLFAPPAAAQAPVRVMFVGDCHSWFQETYFPKLAASGEPAVTVTPLAASSGGATLESLWNLWPNFKLLHGGDQKWDFGVIGIGYWSAPEFTDWAPKFDEDFKKAGAQTVITVPWPDQNDKITVPEYMAVADGLAAKLSARVSPVALAVDRVRRERPGLIEYVDDYHVNAPGWYLDMCVLYATLFDRSPEGLKYRMADVPVPSEESGLWKLSSGWALTDADAAYLQRVAWETVQERQAKK